jgi:hypothetical protein
MENIKKGLKNAMQSLKRDSAHKIMSLEFLVVDDNLELIKKDLCNSLDTIMYLQGLINNLDKENDLDSAINDALKEANHVYKPIKTKGYTWLNDYVQT